MPQWQGLWGATGGLLVFDHQESPRPWNAVNGPKTMHVAGLGGKIGKTFLFFLHSALFLGCLRAMTETERVVSGEGSLLVQVWAVLVFVSVIKCSCNNS